MKLPVKLMRWTLMLSAVGLLSGCATVRGDYCDIAEPIWWNDQTELDVTPDGIVRQVVKHNETWKSLCGV